MLKTYYVNKHTQKSLHKHTYTPSCHHYNHHLYTIHTPHVHFQNKSVYKQNISIHKYFHATYNPIDKREHLNEIHYKYSTLYTPFIPKQLYTGVTYTHLYLPRPDLLFIVQSNNPSCYPKSSNLVFNG